MVPIVPRHGPSFLQLHSFDWADLVVKEIALEVKANSRHARRLRTAKGYVMMEQLALVQVQVDEQVAQPARGREATAKATSEATATMATAASKATAKPVSETTAASRLLAARK